MPDHDIVVSAYEPSPEEHPSVPVSTSVTIGYPTVSVDKFASVEDPLIWWNTHYKAKHEFNGGRIEILFEPKLKGYHLSKSDGHHISFRCPYCHSVIWFYSDHIDKNKGHLTCPSKACAKSFGVHPSGQLFVARDVRRKVQEPVLQKQRLLDWLRYEANYNDWELEEHPTEVIVHINAKNETELEQVMSDFRAELNSRRFEYQEG